MPSFKITNSSYTSLKLSWTHTNANITGYKIYRATSKNGKYSYVATVTPKTDVLEQTLTYNDTKKTFNKTYYYKIRPYHKNEDGTTYYGSYSAVKSKKVVTQAPTVVGTTSGFLKNKLTWKKVSGASGYAIYKLEDGKYVYQKSTTSLSYTDTLKNNNKDLEFVNSYKVRAYRTVSGKKIYGAYSEVITITSKLSTPKLTYTGIDHTSYKVKASSISGATTLELYSCVDEICSEDGRTLINSKASIDETINVNSLADKQYYIIRAVRTINGESIYSDFSEVYTYSSKPAKVDIKDDEKYENSVISKTNIMIAINNTLENQSFELYRSTSKTGTYTLVDSASCMSAVEFYQNLAEALGDPYTEEELEELRESLGEEQYVQVCFDSNVKAGKTYYYKVRAKMVENNITYYGDFSDIDAIKVKPEKVDYIVVGPNKYNSTTVEWSPVDDADGYEVYRATSKNGKYTKVKTTTGTSYTHTGTLNQKYYYKVRAYFLDEKGNKVYGSYSSIKSRAIGLTALDSYPIALSNDNATSSIKSVTITQKTTISNQVVLKFKVNYSKTYAVKKQKVYYTVNFYDKNYNFLTSRELYTTLSKGTKRNYSTTFEVKVPKEAAYYEFE